jgi:hypothetical protein
VVIEIGIEIEIDIGSISENPDPDPDPDPDFDFDRSRPVLHFKKKMHLHGCWPPEGSRGPVVTPGQVWHLR